MYGFAVEYLCTRNDRFKGRLLNQIRTNVKRIYLESFLITSAAAL